MDAPGFRGTDAATSAAAKRWLNASLAHRHGKPWYIAFLGGRVTVMRIVRDRAEAIAVACAMLDEGIEVTGVGPMIDTGQQKIDPASLREICRQRRRV
jgi:predicted Rossmann-fold nucleotide-binding protein